MRATMVDYAERLKAAMNAAGVDTRALSNHLGLSYQGVRKVVLGENRHFDLPNHLAAARFLGVRSEWLALGEGTMRDAKTSTVDWRTMAFSIAAAHPHESVRVQLIDFCERVDQKVAQIGEIADRRAKAHTP